MTTKNGRILGRDDVEKVLKEHLDDLVLGVNHGIERLNRHPAGDLKDYRKRTKANMLYDFIVRDVSDRWEGDPAVRIDDDNETILFVFSGQVGLRIKKIDTRGATSNVLTGRQREIALQQFELPGVQRITCVDCGYCLNAEWTAATEIKIACNKDFKQMWAITLVSGTQATAPLVFSTDTETIRSANMDGPSVVSTLPFRNKSKG